MRRGQSLELQAELCLLAARQDGDFADAPGNFGFDPLSLGSDPATLKWCVRMHRRCGWPYRASCDLPYMLDIEDSCDKRPSSINRYQQAELVHSRWAMVAVAGILFPEASALHPLAASFRVS